MKTILNNFKYAHLLHVKSHENRSTLRLKNGGPNLEKTFLKYKILTFGWGHLKTAWGQ